MTQQQQLYEEDLIKHPNSQYTFESYGYECTIKRNTTYYCGYITLPINHPYYNYHQENIPIKVHGGFTYKNNGTFGFDCAHIYDYKYSYPTNDAKATYKDFEFVKAELVRISKKFRKIENKTGK